MKTILFTILILLSLITFGQNKVLVIEGEIIRTGIPSKFERKNGEVIWGGYQTRTDLHYEDGWRNEILPSYNPTTQRITNRHYDLYSDAVIWDVVSKTAEELAQEQEAQLQMLEQQFDPLTVKRILQKVTKPILENDSITADEIKDLAMLYPQYRVGKSYDAGEVFALDSDLFKVIQAHTSQADWLPESTPALYGKYTPPGQIAEWVQPTGAHDAYQTGDKVLFEGNTYESLIDSNTWSPTAYPAGWKQL